MQIDQLSDIFLAEEEEYWSMQKSPTEDCAVEFLMLHTRFIHKLNSVELSAWTGLKLTLQRHLQRSPDTCSPEEEKLC